MALSLLTQLMIRHDGRCAYCGRVVRRPRSWRVVEQPDSYPTIDHVLPTVLRGRHRLDNMVLACRGCNNLKGDFLVGEFLMLYPKGFMTRPMPQTSVASLLRKISQCRAKGRASFLPTAFHVATDNKPVDGLNRSV